MAMASLRALRVPLCVAISLIVQGEADSVIEALRQNFLCKVPEHVAREDLVEIRKRNCDKVRLGWEIILELNETEKIPETYWPHWDSVSAGARRLCKESDAKFSSGPDFLNESVDLAINAWGTYMVQGRECCNMNFPPYCADMELSLASSAFISVMALLALIVFGAVIASVWQPISTGIALEKKLEEYKPYVDDPVPERYQESPSTSQRLIQELEAAWLQHSCLRALPGAQAYARSTAIAFAALQERFDFQLDSVRCQHEHLLSMWRSMVAVVADRFVEKVDPVDEEMLLEWGLLELWTEMLEGFRVWRKRVGIPEIRGEDADSSEDSEDDSAAMPTVGGARWASIAGAPEHVSAKLIELVAFLCVWGEAGNVRFMPEVLYFITEQLLKADNSGSCTALYGGAPRWSAEMGGPYRSGLYLSKVVRPIYNMVFAEWYDRVEGKGSQRDKKVLRAGFENYLPADVGNYDDWDELFLDPVRLYEKLVLVDGSSFYELPEGQRFANLHQVDWPRSLSDTKTHREVHSLWGVFAATHRIVLIHTLMFTSGVILMTPVRDGSGGALAGDTLVVRLGMIGLLAPIHGIAWAFARWETTGMPIRKKRIGALATLAASVGRFILLAAPVVTYFYMRTEGKGDDRAVAAHFTISALAIVFLLFFSSFRWDEIFPMTHVPLRLRVVRDIFWICVLLVKGTMALLIFSMVFDAMSHHDISMIGLESGQELSSSYLSTDWVMHTFIWGALWGCTFLLFVGDTQLYFCLGCSVLGALSFLVERRCKIASFVVEDAIAKIPQRFSSKVLMYSPDGLHTQKEQDVLRRTRDRVKRKDEHGAKPFSKHFPAIWDRIVDYMRYEDKIDNQTRGDMSFNSARAGVPIYWKSLAEPLPTGIPSTVASRDQSSFSVPSLFSGKTFCEDLLQDLTPQSVGNAEIVWRLKALSRGLGLPMPRPYMAPYFPGITVLIPHYGESILMEKNEVYNQELNVPLIDYVSTKYEDELSNFTVRMQLYQHEWPAAGCHWERYTEEQWNKMCAWTSMRMQTLWRTVAGMSLYYPAIQCHYELQGDKSCSLGHPDVWNPADCFSLIISMQMYHFFNKLQYEHTNKMLAKFPPCLKIAYISCEDKNETADKDRICARQERRYFSCLIDKSCPMVPGTLMLAPKLRIELPGFPILGDGKGDNQNHAIPFMRGLVNQCIDANQGAYFEQMMLLPCALGEFRTRWRGDSHSKRIIGFPEHITSDIGSIGDFAASAEVAFGTLLQRTYSILGARMHYGHPDLMSKIWMIQQGGVSKATKTLNLSEDIFAGMDFTLRGQDRKIRHCEYFHLAKGRDLGFNTVLGFFAKLSSGAGEQIITRQMFRLHQVLCLPEALTHWYAHVGYYMTQFFVSASMPMLCLAWLLMLLTDCHSKFAAFESCSEVDVNDGVHHAAEVMATLLSQWFSYLLFFFLLMTSLPLFMETWMEFRFVTAVCRVVKQALTLSPLMFIFQAKTIGHYVMNELRYGGATYVATGRGLPTERRPFIGTPASTGFKLEKVGGLYLDYAYIAYYDGFFLLIRMILILVVGGVRNAGEAGSRLGFMLLSVGLTIASWLYAPFLFNPYEFELESYLKDMRAWVAFFVEDGGKHWVQWYKTNHLKPRVGLRSSIIDIGFFFRCLFLVMWFTVATAKSEILYQIIEGADEFSFRRLWVLAPPFAFSFGLCLIVTPFQRFMGSTRQKMRLYKAKLVKSMTKLSDDSSEEDGELSEDEEEHWTPVPHQTMKDVEVVPEDQDEAENCCKITPLAFLALVVVALDVIEMFWSLSLLLDVRWFQAIVSCVILKFSMIDFLLWIFEGVFKSKNFNLDSWYGMPISLWLYTHRMARDLVVSSFIILSLLILVGVNWINEMLLPGCSLHMLLIYRDPGHLKRKEAILLKEA